MSFDTIAAIATASAPAGIGVVRISGKDACAVADRVFKSAGLTTLSVLEGYRAAFGSVFDENGMIDEVVALRFKAPHSYTGEDVVELSCHGGTYILRRVLRAVLDNGARLAGAGEFTRRAFENGKLDLTAAESVMDLIGANSRQAHLAAVSAKNGATFKAIENVRGVLVEICSGVAAWTDFPEEDVPEVEADALRGQLALAAEMLDTVIRTADCGRLVREGVETVIVGKPNVGKSTVMNLLARFERSIVTDIPGTTRDVIEESVIVDGITLRLADTAGMRDTDDPVESIGVDLAGKRLDEATLVIAVFDSSREADDDDRLLVERLKGRKVLAIINKNDLPSVFDATILPSEFAVIEISAKNDTADALENAISQAVGLDSFDPSAGVIANERQLDCARKAARAISDAREALESGMTLDAIGVCIDEAVEALCELTGERASDRIIDDVFSRFCVGK